MKKLKKLSDDVDIWADLSPLDFEKWLTEKMRNVRGGGHGGQTSYQLMIVFMRMCGDGVKTVMGVQHSIRGRGNFSDGNQQWCTMAWTAKIGAK